MSGDRNPQSWMPKPVAPPPNEVPAARYRADDIIVMDDGIYMDGKCFARRMAGTSNAEWTAVAVAFAGEHETIRGVSSGSYYRRTFQTFGGRRRSG